MINRAVWAAGAFIAGKLSERDGKGKPRWTIQEILNGQAAARRATNAAARAKGMFGHLLGERR